MEEAAKKFSKVEVMSVKFEAFWVCEGADCDKRCTVVTARSGNSTIMLRCPECGAGFKRLPETAKVVATFTLKVTMATGLFIILDI